MRTIATALLCLFGAADATAQRLQLQAHVEAMGPSPYDVGPGGGYIMPMGRYVRLGLAGTVGLWGARKTASRWDLIGRFTFDPQRQQRWALSLGGGVSLVDHDKLYLAVVADLEGPESKWFGLPFLSASLAGGPRFASGIRLAMKGRR